MSDTMTVILVVWGIVGIIRLSMKLSDLIVGRALRQADLFADSLDASNMVKLVRGRFEPSLHPMVRCTPEAHEDVRWAYIRVGTTLLDVVSPECVDDVEELERSLYLEGLDIIEHGG